MSEVKVIHADCLDAMKSMEADSIDSIVTDPPYGLEFMGKEWDAPWKHGFSSPGYADAERLARPSFTSSRNPICLSCGKRQRTWEGGPAKCSCPAPKWDRKQADESRAFQAWCEEWAREALRVAKPGAHLVAFGGTRTFHRLACAIEDAGWEIRDCLSWLYGSGFPKSLDVSKAIDKAAGAEREVLERRAARVAFDTECQGGGGWSAGEVLVTAPATDAARQWQGWGTALKPAWEPCILARKPLVGTVAANVLAHGTGAINVDACRIAASDKTPAPVGKFGRTYSLGPSGFTGERDGSSDHLNRWPANVALDEEAARILDEQSGQSKDGVAVRHNGVSAGPMGWGSLPTGTPDMGYGGGGASRFFYCAKAGRTERGSTNVHPTVKPLSLMRWLVKLVCPPGGTVLDPFSGSGSTLIAAKAEGFDAIGVEKDLDYVGIIKARLEEATPEWLRKVEEEINGSEKAEVPTSLDDLFGFNK